MIKYNALNKAGRLAVLFMGLCLVGLPFLFFPSHSNFDLQGKTVEYFKGTFVHAQFLKGGSVNLITKIPETGHYKAFLIGDMSILTKRDSLVSGRNIELTHIGNRVLTCQIDGAQSCIARCSNSENCIELERSVTDTGIKIALIILFVFAVFFAVLSWAQHSPRKPSDIAVP